MKLYSYTPGSKGAAALAHELGIKRIKHNGSKFTGKADPVVLNWGASELPHWPFVKTIINSPEAVATVSNKLSFFESLRGEAVAACVPYTTDKDEAISWTEGNGAVCCRTSLVGHSGAGLVLAYKPEEVVNAPLYTRYVGKTHEFRIHICNGDIIDRQRKARRRDIPDEDINWQVRNHANGFIYARENVAPPVCVDRAALMVMKESGLHFGAVDIIYAAKRDNPACVLEINTAPGLEGSTVLAYAKAFKEMM